MILEDVGHRGARRLFSPDGREVCFARNTDEVEATSTNSDLFLVPVTGGDAKRITGDCKGWDGNPLYSPDGRMIAYLSQVVTLEPGDLVFTGTPPGVGMARKPPVWLKPGDVVEVEIDHLGTLRNPVVAEG